MLINLDKLSISSFVVLSLLSCSSSFEKKPILLADREAPIGWVYLRIYEDSTFEFSDSKYQGEVTFKKDSLFFHYNASIPKAGKVAIIKGNYIEYSGGLRERLEITLNKLPKNF